MFVNVMFVADDAVEQPFVGALHSSSNEPRSAGATLQHTLWWIDAATRCWLDVQALDE